MAKFLARFLRYAAVAAALALSAACSGDGLVERTEPLPLGEEHPAAYTEQWLAKNPRALVRPEHVVVVKLEAQSGDGDEDDSGGEGSDEIVYHLDRPMTVKLLAHEGSEELSHLVLHDASGREVGRHHRAAGEAATVDLRPGTYTLVLHHTAMGQPGIEPRWMFVQLAAAGQEVEVASGGAATPEQPEKVEKAVNADNAGTVLLATAGIDCLGGCSFDNSDLRHGSFDGANLTAATFRNAQLDGTSLKAIRCGSCVFTSASMTQADVRGAMLDGSDMSLANMSGILGTPDTDTSALTPTSCVNCWFNGANLGSAQFYGATLRAVTLSGANLSGADLRWADCTGCKILNGITKHFDIAYFQGANLSEVIFTGLDFDALHLEGASLDGGIFAYFTCKVCRFGPDVLGRTTSIVKTQFLGVGFVEADWEGVDFSTVVLGSPSYLLKSGSVKNARLAGLPSNYFWASELARRGPGAVGAIDISGAHFSGMDLTQADFSAGQAIVHAAPDLRGALLSDGTHAISLAAQDLSGTLQFAGLDLRRVNLTNASLFEADLTGTNLSGAILTGADLANTSLKSAKLVGAQLGVAPDSGSTTAANLSGAYMPLADLTDADLRSVKFDNAHVYGEVKFLRARVDSASLIGANLAGADFTQASLADTNFTGAVLVNATFSGAVLQNSVMYKTYLQGASFVNTASVAGLSLVDAYTATASGSWTFTESDGTPFVYGYKATIIGDLAGTAKGVAVCPNGQQGPCSTPAKLLPSAAVPYPPPPPGCIAEPPDYDNCLPKS